MRDEPAKKPKSCFVCGSTRIANIMYGLAVESPELMKEIKEGKIVLGGCCISSNDPPWQCIDCKTKLYSYTENDFDNNFGISK